MTVVRLRGYEPPPHDEIWTAGIVERSTTTEGPWEVALTVDPLSPADTDPANPIVRDFELMDEPEGVDYWYRVFFEDNDGDRTEYSTPVSNTTNITYTPTVKQVATHIRNRTRLGASWGSMPEGALAGTFTPSQTSPTSSEAREVIREAGNFVAMKVGRDVAPKVREMARSVVALRAAMQIELSFYAEQVATNRSPYDKLKELYDDAIAELMEAVIEAGSDGDPVAGQGQMPSYGGFPSTAIGMEHPW